MDYQDIFAMQWKKFCNDFTVNARKRRKEGLNADKLDKWYQQNILRWSSNIETEGTILKQQGAPALREKLLKNLSGFHFQQEVTIPNNKSIFIGIAAVLASLILAVLVYMLLPLPKLLSVLLGIVLIALSVLKILQEVSKAQEQEEERRRKAYGEQLAAYGEKLKSICMEFSGNH